MDLLYSPQGIFIMNNSQALIILLFLSILLIIFLLGHKMTKSSYRYSLKHKKVIKSINYRKVFNFWALMQVAIVYLFIDRMMDNIVIVVGFPFIIVMFVLLYVIYMTPYNVKIDEKEYKEYEKSFNRDKNIDKILS
mgnify:CR=1 FL=1